ncbi:hypothetical protein GTJ88_23655, partial [Escherichia coli]|nr:hypothetical protein [Escherichia coli]
MLFLFAGHVPAASADSACEGRFVNPITDICWSCIFPLSLGSIKVSQGTRSEKLRREVELAEALLKQREQDSDRYSGREDDPQVPRQLR